MSRERQYRVIADRDKGDDMTVPTQQGDRLTWEWTDKHVIGDMRHDELVRIERPVLNTDEPARLGPYPFENQCDSEMTPPNSGHGYRCSRFVGHDGEHGTPAGERWAVDDGMNA